MILNEKLNQRRLAILDNSLFYFDELEKIIPPSLCSHKERFIEKNKTICLKCGRIRFVTEFECRFYLKNKTFYFSLNKVKIKKNFNKIKPLELDSSGGATNE